MPHDYYATLNIDRSADEKDVKAAYRRLARKYHPDVNPNDKAAEAKFKEISEAYEVLGDPEKRKLYDQYGSNWEHIQAGGGANFDFQGQGFGGFESIFETFLGGGPRGGFRFQDAEVMQPRDVEQTLSLTLEEVDAGATRILTYQTMDAQRTREGVATVPTTKKVEVVAPAGIGDGKKLRYRNKGAAGANGKAGDLYVQIHWAPHEKFKVVGDHLETEVSVPYTVAALGGEVKVPTLRSTITVRVPPGSQSGQSLRLAGQGLTRYGGGRSDLLAKIKITVPRSPSDEERRLLQQIADLNKVTA